MGAGGEGLLSVVGGDCGNQRRLTDVQNADPVTGREGTHPGGLCGDVGYHVGHDLCGRRVRGVLQAHHPATAVVVSDHADEPDDGAGRSVAHQFFVLGEKNGLLGQGGAQDQRHRS